VAKELRSDGVDVVSTANNHAFDRCSRGINRTLAALKSAGLKYTGTRSWYKRGWHAVTKERGIAVAWLACTSAGGSKQKKWNSDSWAVLTCGTTDIEKQVRRLKRDYDAVIVTPHWGKEYARSPSSSQQAQARAWLEAGALAVIGNHAHVTQRVVRYTTRDNRKTLIAYSLGNFVSHQGWRTVGVKPDDELAKRSSLFLLLGLSKSKGKTRIDSWKYVPLYVWRKPPKKCSGCKCPKPLGETVSKSKQRCHSFRVMPAAYSSLDSQKKALKLIRSKVNNNKAYLEWSTQRNQAFSWIDNRRS
jgi:poly-gamma-glutamate synthesis protein (capsule biosynthesis protein)